ncbi:MAG: serine hydrolase domain-containing protein [Bacteroidia bacterium]|nr:serine hydrolase domain-containing protein [Bacteroidia bacterium]
MKRLLLLVTLSFFSFFSFSQSPIDSAALDAFMDGQIQTLMQELDINGVTVSVVKGQELFWSKGYGWADEKAGIKVDPAESLFRMGSISKMFVWTAVMQLYEEGKLNLDADIRSYIEDFEIDDSYEEVITMKHLMSHSAGFEDYYIQLFSSDSLPPNSLGEELKKHNPGRIRPPGVHSSYSNHGTGMAAYIVERISGLKWEDYVQERIFDPLGMTKSTFAYNLPPKFKQAHSQGYTHSEGKYSSHSFKGVPLAPVGIASTTAEDMVPFMVAHMNHGKYEEVALLDSTTSGLMQTPLHVHAEGLRGICYGFFDHSRNGYKIVGHGGATEYFFSYMLLMPDEDVGIFISTNTQGGVDLIRKATDAFFDRFYPNTTELNEIELSEEELKAFSGSYLSNRRPHNRFTKIIGLLNTPTEVSVRNGKLWTDGSDPQSWIPIGPTLFQNSQSTARLAFEKDDLGEYAYMYMDASPHVAMERVSGIESRSLNIFILIMSLGLGIFALILWLINFFLKRSYGLSSERQLPIASKFITMVNVLLLLGFAFAFGLTLDSIFEEGVKDSHYLTFVISAIFGLFTLFQFVLALGHFRKDVKIRSSIFYLILSLGMLGLLFMMNYWNLIGFQLT